MNTAACTSPTPLVSAALLGFLIVASINYRLSQHAVFPAQIEDCKAALDRHLQPVGSP